MDICVVGCERSGTSAISSLIAESNKLSFLDDPEYTWYLYPLINVHPEIVSLKLIEDINRHQIVKVPGFATILPYLRKNNYSDFKTIYVVRDPRDNIASLIERMRQSYTGLFVSVDWLGIKPHNPLEALAYRWKRYLDIAIEYHEKNPDDILFVKYEDFLENKSEVIKMLSSFCGYQPDINIIEQLKDRQFRKSWSDTIAGAKRYEKELSADQINLISSICAEYIKYFKY